MIGHHVPAALGAILPLAHFCFLECRQMLGAGNDADSLRFPQAEGIYG
jgi:hypothetical protein